MPCVALAPMRVFRAKRRKLRQEKRQLAKEQRLAQRNSKKENRSKIKAEKLVERQAVKQQKLEKRTAVKAAKLAMKAAQKTTKAAKTAAKHPTAAPVVTQSVTPPIAQPVRVTEKPAAENEPVLMHDGFEVRIPHTRKSFLTAVTSSTPVTPQTAPAIITQNSATNAPVAPAVPADTNIAPATPTTPATPAPAARPTSRFFLGRRRPTRAELINAESRIGSQIFGPIPAGHRREFFHDQRNVWIWYEDWLDETDNYRQLTVRYEVRPTGVYKKISAGHYVRLEATEQENFRSAAHLYLQLVKQKLYNLV